MSFIKHVALAVIASLSLSVSVFAAPLAFDLRAGQVDSSYGMSRNYSVAGTSLTVTGWSNVSAFDHSVIQDKVGVWSGGLGVETGGSPNHSIDSQNGDFDMLLLSFSDMVTLNAIDLGWIHEGKSSRSDVSVMAGSAPLTAGTSWATLLTLANGWKSAGNYNNVGYNEKAVNIGALSSKYWLIGAYNPILGTALANNDSDYEAFKLEKVKVTKTVRVPEPSALLLFGLGVLGLAAARGRKR